MRPQHERHHGKATAMSLEQAKQPLDIKARYPQKFAASQNHRWRPHNQAIRNAISDGMIGKVENVTVNFRKQEDLQGYRAGACLQPLLKMSVFITLI